MTEQKPVTTEDLAPKKEEQAPAQPAPAPDQAEKPKE